MILVECLHLALFVPIVTVHLVAALVTVEPVIHMKGMYV
jgi:hypothetical protein